MIETCHDLSVNVANDRNSQYKTIVTIQVQFAERSRHYTRPESAPIPDFPLQIPVLPGWREAPGQQSRDHL